MHLQQYIVGQFKQPAGKIGKLAGWIMANRKSNIKRSQLTIDALKIKPNDHVLEIGCGPGVALKEVLIRLESGKLVGLDHSIEMITQAEKRCMDAISNNKLKLMLGKFETTDFSENFFDKIFCVNVIQFFDDQFAVLEKSFEILKPQGSIAITYMPRSKNPTREKALHMASTVTNHLTDIGFANVQTLIHKFSPAPAVIVLGSKPLETSYK